ncbi:hypothetical protein FNH09_39795 [Streptomyces adustus]|uniref:Uncharacterized protein n=1 Tax=Streptomyces adustus TaxID=1609272 RepID=A0A5N8VPB1_9ACTN|nr:hypothetical protein [Streptomyces adustus]
MGPGRESCSPHPRGWSRRGTPADHPRSLLPAPAGMVPPRTRRPRSWRPAPRTRGDGPVRMVALTVSRRCSPHPRGWSRAAYDREEVPRLLPAPAGMVPGSAIRH